MSPRTLHIPARLPFKVQVIDKGQQIKSDRGGVLPFRQAKDGSIEFLLMMPVPSVRHPDGPPAFQIARGSRKTVDQAAPEILEPPLQTALRNVYEEAGVRLGSIRQMLDLGVYETYSREKVHHAMHLFAAEIKDGARLVTPQRASQVQWMRVDGSEAMIREKHIPILRDAEDEIRWFLQQDKAQAR